MTMQPPNDALNQSLANPFVALDFGEKIGREMGMLSSRVAQLEIAVSKLDAKIDKVEANLNGRIDKVEARIDKLEAKIDRSVAGLEEKFEALDRRVDKCLVAINIIDERSQRLAGHMYTMFGGLMAAILGGIALQLFK